jgi:adenylate kinase
MQIIFLGAPGAGKGTQAELIAKKFGIPKISTGDMLRSAVAAETPVGQTLKEVMSKGQLVPDDIIMTLIQERIGQPDCTKGYILDGFPRTLSQAEQLKAIQVHIDVVLQIMVPDEEIITRLSGRWIHPSSGRVYHYQSKLPKNPGLDDLTGEPLVQREDDKEATIRHRLAIFHEQTEPLINWYLKQSVKVIQISGSQPVDVVHLEILKALQG